jgi:hypothetical protein
MNLDRAKAQLAARACRALAVQERKQAETIEAPSPVRDALMKSAAGMDELALEFQQYAER